jgi:glycosyl transferase family 87
MTNHPAKTGGGSTQQEPAPQGARPRPKPVTMKAKQKSAGSHPLLSTWAPAALGLVFLLALAYPFRERILTADNDFPVHYISAKLCGTGQLYEPQASYRLMEELHGEAAPMLLFNRPAYTAVFLRPLAWFPYLTAWTLFSILSISSLAAFVVLATRYCQELPLFVTLSIPLLTVLVNGQDTGFILLLAFAATSLASRRWDIAAGLLFALCAIKPHLFFLIPFALVRLRRWRALAGGLAGGAVLFLLGVYAEGLDWIQRWLHQLNNPVMTPESYGLVNLRDTAKLIAADHWIWVAVPVALLAIGLYAAILMRTDDIRLLIAAALPTALLVQFHVGAHDYLLLLLTFALVVPTARTKALRVVATLAVLPPVYLAAMMGAPWNLFLFASIFALLGTVTREVWLTASRPIEPEAQALTTAPPSPALPLR